MGGRGGGSEGESQSSSLSWSAGDLLIDGARKEAAPPSAALISQTQIDLSAPRLHLAASAPRSHLIGAPAGSLTSGTVRESPPPRSINQSLPSIRVLQYGRNQARDIFASYKKDVTNHLLQFASYNTDATKHVASVRLTRRTQPITRLFFASYTTDAIDHVVFERPITKTQSITCLHYRVLPSFFSYFPNVFSFVLSAFQRVH